MVFKTEKVRSVSGIKKSKRITVELKKKIVAKYENGVCVTELAKQYGVAKSTISTIIKNKEVIKSADVAKGVTVISKQRSQVLEQVEKLLLVWINEKQLTGDSVNYAVICEKAKQLHSDLLEQSPSTSNEAKDFKASRGWFEKFRGRTGIRRYSEAASSNINATKEFINEFENLLDSADYVPHQVFNCDETSLFWKKMPKRTYITQEEMALPGYKSMKDRLTLLLCANASGGCKIKPLLVYHSENPRVFKRKKVLKSELPVMWRTNTKAWVTRILFMEWLTNVFAPTVKKFLQDEGLPIKCLLVMDNASAHPSNLDIEYDFITIKFLPPNITPLLQPMNQQIISNFKKLYIKILFTTCFQITNDTNLTLRKFWKNHFNILHCIYIIDKAWNEVSYRTLQSAWRKLWPDCVSEINYDRFDETVEMDNEIVSLSKSLGLEVNVADIQELLDEHCVELTTEELLELQSEQVKAIQEDCSSEDEEITIPSIIIKDMCSKWSELQEFVEKHHPNKFVANKAINLFNNNAMSHFRKILQQRNRQTSLDRFFIYNAGDKSRDEPPKKVQISIKSDFLTVSEEGNSCPF